MPINYAYMLINYYNKEIKDIEKAKKFKGKK